MTETSPDDLRSEFDQWLRHVPGVILPAAFGIFSAWGQFANGVNVFSCLMALVFLSVQFCARYFVVNAGVHAERNCFVTAALSIGCFAGCAIMNHEGLSHSLNVADEQNLMRGFNKQALDQMLLLACFFEAVAFWSEHRCRGEPAASKREKNAEQASTSDVADETVTAPAKAPAQDWPGKSQDPSSKERAFERAAAESSTPKRAFKREAPMEPLRPLAEAVGGLSYEDRRTHVIALKRVNPRLTQAELAAKVDTSRSSVQRMLDSAGLTKRKASRPAGASPQIANEVRL